MPVRIAVTQSNYLPWIGYFKLIANVDKFVFFENAKFTRGDWRNRNRIVENWRVNWLTIPVRFSFHEQPTISEIYTVDESWRNRHLTRISHAYRSAPYFKEYFPEIQSALNLPNTRLSDINFHTIKSLAEVFSLKTSLSRDIQPNLQLGKSERLVEVCKEFQATKYITTPKALSYLDLNVFTDAEIKVEILDFKSCLSPYNQMTHEFDPYVSILDILFREGVNEVHRRFLNP